MQGNDHADDWRCRHVDNWRDHFANCRWDFQVPKPLASSARGLGVCEPYLVLGRVEHLAFQAARRRGRVQAFGPGTAQIREDVGVEQPACQNKTSRTGIGMRSDSISTSRCGEASITAITASPVRLLLRRQNSSAEITTTSSRPRTVTCCGPSLRTRLTNSLKRAFASCSSQWPDFEWRERRRGLDGDDFVVLVMLISITQIPG
jgi:hypothetical protein